MEQHLLKQCQRLLNEVQKTLLWQNMLIYLKENGLERDNLKELDDISSKLDENSFKTPNEWIDHVKNTLNGISQLFGAESEISLCFLTIKQIIEEKAISLVYHRSKEEINDVYNQIKGILREFPNNKDEFSNLLEKQVPLQESKPIDVPETKKFEEFDLSSMYQKLQILPSDSEVQKVVDIIINYEPSYNHENEVVEFDLSKCQPYTLHLITEYLNKL